MLKPTKKITKKEIQRDPFLESVDKAQAHLQEQRSMYMKIAIGLIAVLIGYNVISEKRTQQNTEANSLLGQAMVALDRGDESNAQFQLETIITEYAGTHSAEVAGYHLGKMKYEAGDFTSAEIYLSQFIRDNAVDLMVSSAAYMLADIAVQDGDTNSAMSFLDKGVQKSTDVHTSRMMELEKAKLILAQGDLEGARTIATDILAEKNVTSIQKQTAEEILGKITG
jgi:predicted negative regulator of RcsB-dependent stress response